MIATLEQPSPLDQWRQRLGGRRHSYAQPRPLAALGYLTNGPVIDGLIEVEKLRTVILYDEQLRPGHCALRLAGYSGSRVPWGVRFGGPEDCRFFKDLRLQPVPGGRGYPARTETHLRRLFAVIREYLDSLDAGRFNYRPGWGCSMCDYRDGPCRDWTGQQAASPLSSLAPPPRLWRGAVEEVVSS